MNICLLVHTDGTEVSKINLVAIPRVGEVVIWEGEYGHRKFVVVDVVHYVGATKAQIVTIVGEEQ